MDNKGRGKARVFGLVVSEIITNKEIGVLTEKLVAIRDALYSFPGYAGNDGLGLEGKEKLKEFPTPERVEHLIWVAAQVSQSLQYLYGKAKEESDESIQDKAETELVMGVQAGLGE